MANSVIKTMQSNSISLPFSGSDACGTFGSEIDMDLCARWYFVSAFQPFSWIHRDQYAAAREPFRFKDQKPSNESDKSYMDYMRDAILLKYSLAPYFSTEFNLLSGHGGSFYNPVFFEFPNDPKAYENTHNNFMLGTSLKVSLQTTDISQTDSVYYFPSEP